MISRRNFLSMMAAFAGGWTLSWPKISLGSLFPHFFFTQLKYRGGEWDPNSRYVEAFVEELELRTSIDANKQRRIIELADSDLFFSPLLYMAGRYEFEPFTPPEREILRRFLTSGGFLFAEDTLGADGFGFDRAFRREMKQILPRYELKRLPPDHSVYQSFYLVGSFGGRQMVKPYLEGITIDTWTPVMYSQNDLSGAWSRSRYGDWLHECIPGGELQRKSAFKMGVNIVVYCLTSDYKKDVIHHPFIRRSQNL
ncbi:MAG: DUF4159 domain-containing protein [Desulfobacterales bacterium]|nr:MAG: DUF4159 domain-containing protein [Desulfobacterales bacterium]